MVEYEHFETNRLNFLPSNNRMGMCRDQITNLGEYCKLIIPIAKNELKDSMQLWQKPGRI